jgi:hypothetical protein
VVLGLGIGLPVVAALVWVIRWGGPYFYLHASAFLVSVQASQSCVDAYGFA